MCGQLYAASAPTANDALSSPVVNRCPDCVVTTRPTTKLRPASRDPFSIDALVGRDSETGNAVKGRSTPSLINDNDDDDESASQPEVVMSRPAVMMTTSSRKPLSLHGSQTSQFPFQQSAAAAAQLYAMAASGLLPPIHYNNGARYPLPVTWPPRSQQYGI